MLWIIKEVLGKVSGRRPPQTGASWDWWVRARVMGTRDMLIPEVPRTRHQGGDGVHISGFDQVLFSSQPLNTEANVTLDVDR